MKVAIIGLGWLGEQLGEKIKEKHEVSGTTRTEEKRNLLKLKGLNSSLLNYPDVPSEGMLNQEAIVLNIPPFKSQLEWFKSWPIPPHVHLIFLSSTSVYGNNLGMIDEKTSPLPETENAKLLLEEENWARGFPNHTIIRLGGLIGPGRHPGKYFAGRKEIEGGLTPVNLIHSEDAVRFLEKIIEEKIQGTFNLVHPNHPGRHEYYTNYCRIHRLELPEFQMTGDRDRVISDSRIQSFFKFLHTLE